MDSPNRTPFSAPALHSGSNAMDKRSAPPALTPQSHEAIRELMHEGESANTRNSYQSAMRYWAAWYVLRIGDTMQLPLTAPAVLQFIIDHAEGKPG